MDRYFYFDDISFSMLSIICPIQAFQTVKLPASSSETFYV